MMYGKILKEVNMKRISRIIAFMFAAVLVALIAIPSGSTSAKVPYRTYTENGYGEYVETQTAYIPSNTIVKIMSNIDGIDNFTLNNASDIKVHGDKMYIADTYSSQVVVADLKGNLIQLIGKNELSDPSGLFITDEYIYVADETYVAKKEGAVLVYDHDGNLVTTYNKPKDVLYGSAAYQPSKLIVDAAGNMYIVGKANSNGVIQISPTDGGTFLGYFGANAAEVSAMTKFLSIILSDSQIASMSGSAPLSIDNIAIDSKGLIYTITGGTELAIKKLNIAGTNLFLADFYPTSAITVSVGQYDNIYVGTSDGYIYEYTSEGSCLFVFGGQDANENRVGLFKKLTALTVDSNDNIYVLDSETNEIQVFAPTEFTQLIHESLVLYSRGLYEESKEPLEQVIRMNGLFDYANKAMAQAFFYEGSYKDAMNSYRLAKDKEGYSEAFWEVRNVWLQKYVVWLLAAIVGLVVIIKFFKFANRKWSIFAPIAKATKGLRDKMLYKRLVFCVKYMRHPMDGTYAVKREGMKSYLSAGILTVIFILFNIIYKYFCGFIFKTVKDGRYEISSDIMTILGILIAASAVTYLVSTINDGEGRFKEILCGYVYSLTPYILIKPFLFVLSMVLTLNEAFIMEFANLIVIVWMVILIFLTVKEINNYSFKETCKVIGLTFFTAFVFILMGIVIYILASQVVGFVVSIYGEVVYRIGN